MRIIERAIECDPDKTYRIYPLTDWHLGSAYCDEALLQADIERIKNDPYAYWLGGGDYADFINRADKRHRESNLARWLYGKDDIAAAQIEHVVTLAKPIADKCLALCKGNHEDAILELAERDVYGEMVSQIARPNQRVRLGYGGFVVVRWQWGKREGKHRHGDYKDVWTTVIFAHHGAGGGVLAGGDALMLERLGMAYDFDAAMIGHRHSRRVIRSEQWRSGPTANRIECRQRIAAICGSYLRSFDEELDTENYAERKMLPPRAVGGLCFEFRPGGHAIKAVL